MRSMEKAMFQQLYCTMGLLCLLLLLATSPAAIADRIRHVSKKELPGIKEDEQVRTIGEAVSLVEPGDTVIIHDGIYREEVVIEKSGLPDKPIKFQAAVGGNVIVTGADRITDWQEEESTGSIYSIPWPHKFVAWNKNYTHPNDDYHLLIGRCEQVFVNGYALRQVLSFDKLSRGTFFVDLDEQRLYVWSADNSKLSDDKQFVEASVRNEIWVSKGNHISVKGIRFRYATNHAQRGAAIFSGNHNIIENCVFEDTNASGATFTGQNIVVRGCAFQNNGQMGFGAGRAHNLLMTNCTIRNNNTKGYNRGWEAGGNKIAMTRGAIIEKSVFAENRGNGIWFDIGNEDNEIRN